MKSIFLFLTILLFSFTSYAQNQRDSLNKVVHERIKDINQDEIDNPYYTKQEIEDEYVAENNIFQSLSKPNENSDLSNYFKIYLEKGLLRKIDFSEIKSSPYYSHISNKVYNHTIRLTFEINKKNKATNFRLNTGNKELDKEVIRLFKKYPLEKLSLGENAKTGKISLQLFARENKTTIIKASEFAVVDQLPILKGCENTQYNWELNKCLYDQLFKYILANISLKTISEQDLKGEIHIRPRFSIDATGKIFKANSIAPNKIIKDEIDRIILSYDQVLIPGKRNNIPKITYCDTYRLFVIQDIK
ncbi:hypothetical protein SAMN05444397_11440 [Flavobacterium aquidurense]|uniref:TonB protein C-terminal n=1 Tax=Flavobacterium frigidimaris TaxID=262320 RepID=A0ABX4BN11_FLAFR|nr:hypothetical protein [Flavobacterium frigidimaris]OXA77868.1 hypothetical protein B0A65_14885 [Flavobacterium frigidimaris]SDZ65313.1 hypothetical protein SAMN05444397_11440 [Flavobacterium aquidurense]